MADINEVHNLVLHLSRNLCVHRKQAKWLSFLGSKAIQYQVDNNLGLHYADENYARE